MIMNSPDKQFVVTVSKWRLETKESKRIEELEDAILRFKKEGTTKNMFAMFDLINRGCDESQQKSNI